MCYSEAVNKKGDSVMQRQSMPDTQTHAVNLRIRGDIRSLIDRAAQMYGKTRSDFMIDAARKSAEDALLDQIFVRVDKETYDHFLNVLDQPPSGEGFNRLMKVHKLWEQ